MTTLTPPHKRPSLAIKYANYGDVHSILREEGEVMPGPCPRCPVDKGLWVILFEEVNDSSPGTKVFQCKSCGSQWKEDTAGKLIKGTIRTRPA